MCDLGLELLVREDARRELGHTRLVGDGIGRVAIEQCVCAVAVVFDGQRAALRLVSERGLGHEHFRVRDAIGSAPDRHNVLDRNVDTVGARLEVEAIIRRDLSALDQILVA